MSNTLCSPAKDNDLKHYCVSLHEESGDTFQIKFFCRAEDADHADEQALNAYPLGEVKHTTEVSPDSYPYN